MSQSGSVDCQFSSVAAWQPKIQVSDRVSLRRSTRSTHIEVLRVRAADAVVQLCARIRFRRLRRHSDLKVALREPGPLQPVQFQLQSTFQENTATTHPNEQLNCQRGSTHHTSDLVDARV